MAIRFFEQVFSSEKNLKFEKEWISSKSISPHIKNAVICSEDQNFKTHFGFDFEAIEKAIKYNSKHQKIRGASTISQQTAKNVFLWNGRNWIRKSLETYFTILIEIFWTKEKILEVYLNIIEFGDGIYGIEKASQIYFKKSANKLSKNESALLAAILPNPRRWNLHHPTKYILKRKNHILQQMAYNNF